METYIALLRGVNVGGKNKLSMPALKAAFEDLGFTQVVTYINSGNLLFCCEKQSGEALQEKCRRTIAGRFGMDIAVSVFSAADLSIALENAPVWWDDGSEARHNAIFVIAPAEADAVIRQVGEADRKYEKVEAFGRVIFWSAPLQTYARSQWSRIHSLPVYQDVTIRNANTAKKLAALAK